MILQKTSDLGYLPKRIVSLVPSQTELLYDLGLENETIGITKFCVHPPSWHQIKEKVGGTKTIQIDKIHRLQPDLILANKEENVKEQVEQLSINYPVWLTEVSNLESAGQMITDIGTLTGKYDPAAALVNHIQKAFKTIPAVKKPVKTAYLIWRKPYLTVGGDTFIHAMLHQCGFENVFADKSRYPEVSPEELLTVHCQCVLLSSEPYPFKQKHIAELCRRLPATKIILVDGEFFSWYGSRLLKAPEYFNSLLKSIGN